MSFKSGFCSIHHARPLPAPGPGTDFSAGRQIASAAMIHQRCDERREACGAGPLPDPPGHKKSRSRKLFLDLLSGGPFVWQSARQRAPRAGLWPISGNRPLKQQGRNGGRGPAVPETEAFAGRPAFYWGMIATVWAALRAPALLPIKPQTAPSTPLRCRNGRQTSILDETAPYLPIAATQAAPQCDRTCPYLPPLSRSRITAFIRISDRPLGITRPFRNLAGGGMVQGGSTLAQQLAKNLF